ncbi:MAG TPA: MerR family transcriptional regulator [Steroidobacteraceae bacterium]|nr:MerR family transcriptional regulator [Steroidobacteraceae bacterium]
MHFKSSGWEQEMREYSIGEVAREAGLAASALRYYEKAGLLPAPPRRSRQRRYTEAVFGRIYLIRLALEAGFTIGETLLFLTGFSQQTPPAARWRALAARKLEEVEALMDRAQRMKLLLETSFQCRCPRLEDCEQFLRSAKRKRVGSC